MNAELKKLHRLLSQKEWLASELAVECQWSIPTVYRRLEELAEYVVVLKRKEKRPTPGPTPKRFYVARLREAHG